MMVASHRSGRGPAAAVGEHGREGRERVRASRVAHDLDVRVVVDEDAAVIAMPWE